MSNQFLPSVLYAPSLEHQLHTHQQPETRSNSNLNSNLNLNLNLNSYPVSSNRQQFPPAKPLLPPHQPTLNSDPYHANSFYAQQNSYQYQMQQQQLQREQELQQEKQRQQLGQTPQSHKSQPHAQAQAQAYAQAQTQAQTQAQAQAQAQAQLQAQAQAQGFVLPQPTPTPKRKRGRPPKKNSFAERITTTVNISVNTSPLHGSPAESNSNMAAKQGAPNVFTPLMRVSPSNKGKKKRKYSSTSTVSNSSPVMSVKRSKSYTSNSEATASSLATPLTSQSTYFRHSNSNSSLNSYLVDKKALDNMSRITQSQGYYGTPPATSNTLHEENARVALVPVTSSATTTAAAAAAETTTNNDTVNGIASIIKTTPSATTLSTVPVVPTHSKSMSLHYQQNTATDMAHDNLEPRFAHARSFSEQNTRNLLPPVSLMGAFNEPVGRSTESHKSTPGTQPKSTSTSTSTSTSAGVLTAKSAPISRKHSEDFLLSLTVDKSGKAVFSTNAFSSVNSTFVNKKETVIDEKAKIDNNVEDEHQNGKKKSILAYSSDDTEAVVNHGHSAPRTPLRRHNSDITGLATHQKLESTQLASIDEIMSITNTPTAPSSQSQPQPQQNTSLQPPSQTLPQTPRDLNGIHNSSFLSNFSTGLTPMFNLTPQFNSLMNSVMSLNSPQYKKLGGSHSNYNLMMNPFLANNQDSISSSSLSMSLPMGSSIPGSTVQLPLPESTPILPPPHHHHHHHHHQSVGSTEKQREVDNEENNREVLDQQHISHHQHSDQPAEHEVYPQVTTFDAYSEGSGNAQRYEARLIDSNVHDATGGVSDHANSSDESGDARLALKRVMYEGK